VAASPVLVDSSYYIGLTRQGQDPLRTLAYAAVDRDLVTCGIVRCEVARGLRHRRTLERFQALWDVMLYVPTDNKLWAEAEEMLWQLDRGGTTLPLQDVVIACCALRLDALVLTFDSHFHRIPGIRAIDRVPD